MENLNITITKEELQSMIDKAVYKATTSRETGDYELITEAEFTLDIRPPPFDKASNLIS